MQVRIGIKLKIRFFGITFGTLSRVFRVSMDDGFKLVEEGESFEYPLHAQIVFNDRGVRLGYWTIYGID